MIDALYLFVAVYALLNVVSFLMYVWDKHKAKEDKWRTPEATLLLAALTEEGVTVDTSVPALLQYWQAGE